MKKNKQRMNLACHIIAILLCTICILNTCVITGEAKKSSITSEKELQKARDNVYSSYVKSLSSRKKELKSGRLTLDGKTMTYTVEIIGKPGPNGYPIYFGLHGGGNPDTRIQKEQYEIMQEYYNYSITSGIYIVPLSLEARYNEHYLPESFLFYDRLIEDAVLFENGDPNRVYFMGFSSGGDGVYAISALFADRLAATNMSAGFPNVHKLENLYNLPMCLQVGEKDSAYNRNKMVARYSGWLKELNKEYGGGYEHTVYIHKNGTHNSWADVTTTNQMVVDPSSVQTWLKDGKNVKYVNANTDAVRWVNQYTRNPIPERVVWATIANDGLRPVKAFYWLDRDGYLQDATIVASYDKKKNTIRIEECDATKGTLKVYLRQDMVDLFKDVKVEVLGKSYTVTPVISEDIMKATLAARGDVNYMFDAEIDITLAENKNAIQVEAVSSHKDEYDVQGIDNLISWNKDGLFRVDGSLFGLTYDQLCKKLGVKMDKPVKWEWWGNNLYWTSYGIDAKHSVVFMFQNNKTAIIYSEADGAIPKKVKESAAAVLGARLDNNGIPKTGDGDGIMVMDSCSLFFLENNVYDNKDHMVQKYIYYKYE